MSAEELARGAAQLDAALDAAQIDQLLAYAGLLEKWNKSFNLVSRQDIGRLGSRHLLDSLTAVRLLQGPLIMDLGTGAGLPGIVLAVAAPQFEFLLCDRSSRRIRFLQQVIAQLELCNTQVWLGDYGQDYPSRGGFNTVVARGVATVGQVWAMVQAQLAADGRVVVYERTGTLDTPVREHTEPAFQTTRQRFDIPGLASTHTLICAQRTPKATAQSEHNQ